LTGKATPSGKLPYRKKTYLLTKAERSFFGVLLDVAGKDFHVFCKVRLADLLDVVGAGDKRQSHLNRISAKHVDFLLCDREHIGPVLAIELDDSSHKATNRQNRDLFVDKALADAALPLLRIPAQATYQPRAVAEQIQQKVTAVPQPTPKA
jgi:hypothetical protein